MCLGDLECPADHDNRLKGKDGLRSKLVLHRGYHSIDASYLGRPLENTRQAYLDGAKAGALFAECDVWTTKDGVLILSHDSTFAASAAQPDERLALLPIAELEWAELSELKLKDGSTPVKLDTVLEDLCGTEMQLVIELKTSAAASQLGAHLAKHAELACRVAWVMSFSFLAVKSFVDCGGRQANCRGVWILDNPSEAYTSHDEGETTFNCASEGLGAFLERVDLKQSFLDLQCGLYLQYNPCIAPVHLKRLRAEMIELFTQGSPASQDGGEISSRVFLGLWSDAHLDASFDCANMLTQWLDVVDAINTDLPHMFWLSSTTSLEFSQAKASPEMKAFMGRPRIESESTAASGSFSSSPCDSPFMSPRVV